MAVYGGTQRGLPQLTLDPVTGELVYGEGNDLEISPTQQHTSIGQHFKTALPYFLPAVGAMGLDAALGAGAGIGGGASSVGSTAAPAAAGAGAGAAGGAAGAGSLPTVVAGVGGASRYLPMISSVARGIGAFGDQMAGNRQAEQSNEFNYDVLDQNRYALELRRAQQDLQNRQFSQNLYDTNTQRAIRGGALQGVQDLNIQAPAGIPMANVTGGLKPSAIQGREQIGGELQRQALLGMMEGRGSTTPGGQIDPRTQMFIEQFQAANQPTAENYARMFEEAKRQGINLERPTHAGGTLPSNDKVVSGSRVLDLITNEGSPNASWSMSPDGFWVNGRPASDPMGAPPVLPEAPRFTRRSSQPGALETGLGVAGTGLSWLPDILSMFAQQAPKPAMPRITAPNPSSTMRGVSFY